MKLLQNKKIRGFVFWFVLLGIAALDFAFGSGGGATIAACLCGELQDVTDEADCDDPIKGVEGEIAVVCPEEVESIPDAATGTGTCKTLDGDIVTTSGWTTWTSDTVKARLVSDENDDGTWNTVITLFFPGISDAKKCQFGTKRSRYLTMVVTDKAGNVHFIRRAKRKGKMDTSTCEGSDDVGFTMTYTQSNNELPPSYTGVI